MNQEKIGKFIQQKRKEKNLTQGQLAEQLGVSNRAVSKWENGLNMPDLSLFKPLCEILGISINELMSAEEIKEDNYREELESNMIKLANYNKKKSDIIGYLVLNLFGIILFIIGIAFHQTVNHFSALFEIIGGAFIVIGFLKLTRSLKLVSKIIVNVIVIIVLVSITRLFEVMNIMGEFNPPKYYYYKTEVGRCTKYKKIFGVVESYHDRDTFEQIKKRRNTLYYIDNEFLHLTWAISYNISEEQLIEDVCINNMNDEELYQKYDTNK